MVKYGQEIQQKNVFRLIGDKEMKEQIKKIIARNPILYIFLQLCKYRKDKEYIELVRGLRDNPNIINAYKGEKNFDKTICLVEVGGDNDGFFACVRWALDGLYFCNQFGFIPVVKFSDNSLYSDNSFPDNKNVFEYYFKQPSNIQIKDIKKYSYIQYSSRNRLLAESLNGGVNYEVSEEYQNQMAQIMRKYLRFNDDVNTLIKQSVIERKINDKVLGVHIRGTDYKANYKNHPSYIPPEEYYSHIYEAFKMGKFNQIYLATDDQEILDSFIQEFGKEKVLYAKNNARVTGNKGVHITEKTNHYQTGLDVICDMATLSYCNGIISGLSQVSTMARIYKKSRNEEFMYDKKLNNGINKTGKSFSVK